LKGFLFDENLPARVTFVPSQPVIHSGELGSAVSDTAIWQEARRRGWVIVSKDADFSHRMMTQSPPPWVVHLRFGNLRLKDYQAAPARLWPAIEELLPEHKLINVHLDRIEAVKD
jgi:predicted nuclease of predicted toxin-antitoxin system